MFMRYRANVIATATLAVMLLGGVHRQCLASTEEVDVYELSTEKTEAKFQLKSILYKSAKLNNDKCQSYNVCVLGTPQKTVQLYCLGGKSIYPVWMLQGKPAYAGVGVIPDWKLSQCKEWVKGGDL